MCSRHAQRTIREAELQQREHFNWKHVQVYCCYFLVIFYVLGESNGDLQRVMMKEMGRLGTLVGLKTAK